MIVPVIDFGESHGCKSSKMKIEIVKRKPEPNQKIKLNIFKKKRKFQGKNKWTISTYNTATVSSSFNLLLNLAIDLWDFMESV